MNVPIIMPQMGQSVAEGTVVRWLKNAGDRVQTDEMILEIESDKITAEIGSPATGVLAACLKREGEVAAVGEVIGNIHVEVVMSGPPTAINGPRRPHAGSDQDQELVAASPSHHVPVSNELPDITREWLSPYVMRLALQNNISMAELTLIHGSGRQGRLTRSDLLDYLARRTGLSGAAAPAGNGVAHGATQGEVIPMTSIRRTIADHMVQSIRTSAHVTMVHAVDMSSVVKLRGKIKDTFQATHGVKMTYTAVLLFVTARVLRQFPSINASVSGTNIILRNEVNIGCAVALPDESLVVPVVHHADTKSFPEVARELDRLIEISRQKALRREDIDGGTFTISNFGAFGSLIGTPIINQPQVAILGVGAIYKAPVVVENQVCIRDQVYLSLTFDHRVIDGAMGGRFLNTIQTHTEALTADDLSVSEL